jgi:predicted site-specific integrase-resolvase
MANALVTQNNRLLQAEKMRRAAQYVRMSTDRQKYSIENQAAHPRSIAFLTNAIVLTSPCRDLNCPFFVAVFATKCP